MLNYNGYKETEFRPEGPVVPVHSVLKCDVQSALNTCASVQLDKSRVHAYHQITRHISKRTTRWDHQKTTCDTMSVSPVSGANRMGR